MTRLRPVFSAQEIAQQVDRVAAEITARYREEDGEIVALCVLKGAFVFFADLVRKLDFEPQLDFVRLASYGQATSPGEKVTFSKDMEISVKDKHVLIVEDIVDTGRTLAYLTKVLETRGARSIAICSLIDKRERREVELDVAFSCFQMDKGFVVGFGLDYAERYRQLPGVYEVCEDA